MDKIKKRNSRKKQSFPASALVSLLCLALAVGLVAALAALLDKQKTVDELIRQNYQLMEELEKEREEESLFGKEMDGSLEDGEGAQAGEPEGSQTQDMDEERAEGEEGLTDEASKEETPKEETTKEEPTAPPVLESLSGLAPGTVIREEQLDFSNLEKYFMSWEIEAGDNLYQRINGKSYRDNPYVPLSTLRYVKLPHYNFTGELQVGELVVNQDILEDVKDIFMELFQAKYQIQSMYLIDNYWTGDPDTTDTASIDVNNTSAFCYREITGGGRLSNHAYGRAIDLNPQQNPYVSYSTGQPKWSHSNADAYIARDTGLPHVITHEDLAYKLFKEHGFSWGGDWNNPKDYQHFDKNNR